MNLLAKAGSHLAMSGVDRERGAQSPARHCAVELTIIESTTRSFTTPASCARMALTSFMMLIWIWKIRVLVLAEVRGWSRVSVVKTPPKAHELVGVVCSAKEDVVQRGMVVDVEARTDALEPLWLECSLLIPSATRG